MPKQRKTDFYFVLLTSIHITGDKFGSVERTLTLVSDKNAATAFFLEEADDFIRIFFDKQQHFVGGHILDWEVYKEANAQGFIIVRAVQIAQ